MPGKHKVLVVGSCGMLGSDLCKELAGHYELICTDVVRRSSFVVRRYHKCDISKKKDIYEVVKKTSPDIIIHAAAYTDVDGCELDPKRAYLVNSLGTENVALACKSIDATLIYISTDFVFNGRKMSPYTESDKTDPLSVYGDSKLEGEKAVAGTLKEHFIVRTSWLYGACGRNFVDTIISKAKEGKVLKVVDDQIGSPTYTKDLAKAIHALIDRVKGQGSGVKGWGTYHISNRGIVSWYDYAKTILKYAGLKAKILPISSDELGRPAKRPAMSALDNSKFRRFTGFKMRGWREALREHIGESTAVQISFLSSPRKRGSR